MKIIPIILLFSVLSFSGYGQIDPETKKDPFVGSDLSLDSLRSKRQFLSTALYQMQTKLRPAAVLALYQNDPKAKRHYLTGLILQPVAPIMALSGVAFGYVALKGKSGVYSGRYGREIVTANYTTRSRPKLAAGLGLFIAGIALVEFSNELVAKSARGYNLRHEGQLTSKERPSLHFGLTDTGNLGLFARF